MNHPFTPTFILQAKAAEEIQAQADAHRGPGNFKDCNLSGVFVIPDWPEGEEDQHENDSWLPRLDQLLGMLGEVDKFLFALLSLEDNDKPFLYEKPFRGIEDWHELALAVVMKERWGKTWREGKWTKTA